MKREDFAGIASELARTDDAEAALTELWAAFERGQAVALERCIDIAEEKDDEGMVAAPALRELRAALPLSPDKEES